MNDSDPSPHRLLMPPIQQWGAVLWPSFFTAVVAAAVFFAFVDPLRLAASSFPDYRISRECAYLVVFFLLWLATASSSAVSWFLLRPMTVIDDETPYG